MCQSGANICRPGGSAFLSLICISYWNSGNSIPSLRLLISLLLLSIWMWLQLSLQSSERPKRKSEPLSYTYDFLYAILIADLTTNCFHCYFLKIEFFRETPPSLSSSFFPHSCPGSCIFAARKNAWAPPTERQVPLSAITYPSAWRYVFRFFESLCF